ncbi:MAG: retron St85 family RNA-directed DNA polymerase [Gammaproteobacteria bacterium]|jgi:hypothetical protein|nr:retron St85 family RNA-directed DNA polymerase [Gammaproteobacteria bacterium]
MNSHREPLFDRLLALSPFSERELEVLIATAPNRYKNHTIKKRNGRGNRLISQPTAEIKLLQRLLIDHELSGLPIHETATAYRKHSSIHHHAAPHAAARYLLKLDFKDFFPSLTEHALRHRLRLDTSYTEPEINIICRLLCRKPKNSDVLCLSIGAPSSPFISNYLMFELDTRLHSLCLSKNARYTRYADDIAISTNEPHLLDDIEQQVHRLLLELDYLGITINKEKTVNVSKKHRRILTGLILSNGGAASIGREEKRRLRAAMHTLARSGLPGEAVAHLRGKLAFLYSIDAEFVRHLCTRYGFPNVAAIRALNKHTGK